MSRPENISSTEFKELYWFHYPHGEIERNRRTMKYSSVYRPKLADIYKEKGVETRQGKLRHCCNKATICWNTRTHEKLRVQTKQGFITYPYVGDNYFSGGLVVVATNHRDNHGAVKGPLKDHTFIRKQIMVLDKSGGFYGNLARYIMVLLSGETLDSKGSEIDKYWDDSKEAFNKIALVQGVKCNPRRGKKDQNQPTAQMWNNCPKYILPGELRILKPGIILILGITNHEKKLGSLKELGYEKIGEKNKNGVRYYSFGKSFHGKLIRQMDVYVANHPSHPVRSIGKICKDLLELRENH
jgi:hypothetical protein